MHISILVTSANFVRSKCHIESLLTALHMREYLKSVYIGRVRILNQRRICLFKVSTLQDAQEPFSSIGRAFLVYVFYCSLQSSPGER